MVIGDDPTLHGGHTVQYTGHVSEKCPLETCMNLLPNVTPINGIRKGKIHIHLTFSQPFLHKRNEEAYYPSY